MYAQADRTKENKSRVVAISVAQKKNKYENKVNFFDNYGNKGQSPNVKSVDSSFQPVQQIKNDKQVAQRVINEKNKEKFRELFKRDNYSFSTQDDGRLSSWYFEDLSGNMGRYRREHPRGPLLIHQSNKALRLFVKDIEENLMGEKAYLFKYKKHKPLNIKIYTDLQENLAAHPNYSLSPENGWHVIEMLKDGSLVHGSKGTVVMEEIGSDDFVTNYNGDTHEW